MTTTAPIHAHATVTGARAVLTHPDGHTETLTAGQGEDIRAHLIRTAAAHAAHTQAPVALTTSGDRGRHHLLIHPDGHVTPAPETATTETEDAPRAAAAEADLTEMVQRDRVSFLDPTPGPHPGLEHGWRALLTRIGVTIPTSAAQRARAAAEGAVSQQWAGCRSVAVVNGKGGVGKTLSAAMFAAVFARYGGGNVLAWDNNDTRGTLGWRTETGRYDTTIRDLLPAAPELLSPTAGVSDITRYVHHQPVDRYDVLRSNPELLATDQRLTTAEFDQLLRVAARFYRLVIFDSGNDESADRWLRMIDASTQLVIPTLVEPEPAESAALLLDALRNRDEHSRHLADTAVVVITQAKPAPRADLHRLVSGFESQVAHVAVIPHDPALTSGQLRFDALRPKTRAAWVTAAAHAAHGL